MTRVGDYYVIIKASTPVFSSPPAGSVVPRDEVELDFSSNVDEVGGYYSFIRGFKYIALRRPNELSIAAMNEEYFVVMFPHGDYSVKRQPREETVKVFPAPLSIECDALSKGKLHPYSVYVWRDGAPLQDGRVVHYVY